MKAPVKFFLSVIFLATSLPGRANEGKLLLEEHFDQDVMAGWVSTSLNPDIWENPKASWKIFQHYAVKWDEQVGRTSKGSYRFEPQLGHVMLISKPLPISSEGFIDARVWAKLADADGQTYLSLQFYKEDQVVGEEVKGGAPIGVPYMPNVLFGSHDWAPMKAFSEVPSQANAVRVHLIVLGNQKGKVWFDDVTVRYYPKEWGLGRLHHQPLRKNPASLKSDDYVQIKNGRLMYKSKPFRIWSSQGNLLAQLHRDIDWEIDEYAACGFNGYRTLYWDQEITEDYTPGDGSWQDRLDYVIAALGQKGIFVWMDVLNSCKIYPEQVDVIDDPATADEWKKEIQNYYKENKSFFFPQVLWVVWDERSERIYHRYIEKVMAHQNKYNGLTYGLDPTIFCWELTNEQWWLFRILWGQHLSLPEFFQKQFYRRWNQWLVKKYQTTEKLQESWGSLLEGESLEKGTVLLLPLLGETKTDLLTSVLGLNVQFQKASFKPEDFSKHRSADVLQFLNEMIINHKQRAYQVLRQQGKKGLGCQIVPVIFDTGYSGNIHSFYLHSFADAIAVGTYVDMRAWSKDEPTFPFASGLNKPPSINNWLDSRRLADKATFIYETMIFGPQKYRAEYMYRVLAWAAIQQVDVIDFHYYGHPLFFRDVPQRKTLNPLPAVSSTRVWDGVLMREDEVLMSTVQLAGEIFKRGYLEGATKPTTLVMGSDRMWDIQNLEPSDWQLMAAYTAFERGVRWKFEPQGLRSYVDGILSDGRDAEVIKPTSQIEYHWKQGYMVINDHCAKALVGFLPEEFVFDRTLKLESIHVHNPDNMPFVIDKERYAAIGFVSLDNQPLERSTSIMASLVSTSFNSGFEMDLERFAQDTEYGLGLGRSITKSGYVPVLTARVGMVVKAPWLKGKKCTFRDFDRQIIQQKVCQTELLEIPSSIPVYLLEIECVK